MTDGGGEVEGAQRQRRRSEMAVECSGEKREKTGDGDRGSLEAAQWLGGRYDSEYKDLWVPSHRAGNKREEVDWDAWKGRVEDRLKKVRAVANCEQRKQ